MYGESTRETGDRVARQKSGPRCDARRRGCVGRDDSKPEMDSARRTAVSEQTAAPDGQVHPIARSRLSCNPIVNTIRSCVHPKVPAKTHFGKTEFQLRRIAFSAKCLLGPSPTLNDAGLSPQVLYRAPPSSSWRQIENPSRKRRTRQPVDRGSAYQVFKPNPLLPAPDSLGF